jgi:hypothetical protein
MADTIRFRIWLIVLLPFAVLAAVGVWIARTPKEKPSVSALDAGAPTDPTTPLPPTPQASVAWQPQATITLQPPEPAAPPSVALAASASSRPSFGLQPEPVPEIDAFAVRPPGMERWTKEQKLANRRELLAKLDERGQQVERELADAERAGDVKKAEQKRVTLAHIRRVQGEIEARLREVADASP